MKKFLSLVLVFAMGWLFVPTLSSAADATPLNNLAAPVAPPPEATFSDITTSLEEARRLGIALSQISDHDTQLTIIEDIKRASADVNNAIAGVEKDPALTPTMKTKLDEFKTIWAEFVQTRDEEIIPAILAGDMDSARRIGTMIQLGRVRRMTLLLQP